MKDWFKMVLSSIEKFSHEGDSMGSIFWPPHPSRGGYGPETVAVLFLVQHSAVITACFASVGRETLSYKLREYALSAVHPRGLIDSWHVRTSFEGGHNWFRSGP